MLNRFFFDFKFSFYKFTYQYTVLPFFLTFYKFLTLDVKYEQAIYPTLYFNSKYFRLQI